jgi:hypothetical protein
MKVLYLLEGLEDVQKSVSSHHVLSKVEGHTPYRYAGRGDKQSFPWEVPHYEDVSID